MKGKISVRKVRSGRRNKRWRVSYYLPSGKPKTRHFTKKQDAELYAAELGTEGYEPGFSFDPWERALLVQLRRQAERAGLSFSDFLLNLINESTKLTNKVIPLSQLAETFLAKRKDELRSKTFQHYDRMISKFLLGQESRAITDFSPELVMRWVRQQYRNASSQASCSTPILAMFRWAADKSDEWGLSKDWLIRTKKKNYVSQAKVLPFVFSPEEVASLLECACEKLKPVLAAQAFGGLRPHEMCSDAKKDWLCWESIDLAKREIRIPWKVDKTNSEAVLRDLPANLWAWLETVPVEMRTGRICKCSYRTFRKWRKKALEEATGRKVWPKDALRHSFATYNYFQNNLEHTLYCMRHSDGSKMLWKHYLGEGSKQLAQQYFSIFPAVTKMEDSRAS